MAAPNQNILRPHQSPEFREMNMTAKTEWLQKNVKLANWKRSDFIFVKTNINSNDFDIRCNYKSDPSSDVLCNRGSGSGREGPTYLHKNKTQNLNSLIKHWKHFHCDTTADDEKETELFNKVFDYEVTKYRTQGAQASKSAPKDQKKITDFKTFTMSRRDELLVGLTARSWRGVGSYEYLCETGQLATVHLKNRNVVGPLMRDFAYRLQHLALEQVRRTSGILTFDSGTIWNWRMMPILYITSGFVPILLCVNPDSVFKKGEHTKGEINRLLCQVREVLEVKYEISVKFAVADGAPNGQSMDLGNDPNANLRAGGRRFLDDDDDDGDDEDVRPPDDLLPMKSDDDDPVNPNNRAIDLITAPTIEREVVTDGTQEELEKEFADVFRVNSSKSTLKPSMQVASQLKSSIFTPHFSTTPSSLVPPEKLIDMPHILNNITHLYIKNDKTISEGLKMIEEKLKVVEAEGLKKEFGVLPRIIVTRWNTYQLLGWTKI